MTWLTDEQAVRDILEIGRRMYAKGFAAGNDGNISARVGDGEIWTTPSGVSKGFMTEDMLVKMSLDGKVLKGSWKPSSEVKMHLRLYREMPDCGGVVHAGTLSVKSEYTAKASARTSQPGGGVDADRLISAGEGDGFVPLFAHSPLEKAAALGAEALEGGSLTAFERACDNGVNAYLRSAKLVSYGPEAVVAYIAAVEGEITAVRMILTGRLSGVEPETIRERLRDLYA